MKIKDFKFGSARITIEPPSSWISPIYSDEDLYRLIVFHGALQVVTLIKDKKLLRKLVTLSKQKLREARLNN